MGNSEISPRYDVHADQDIDIAARITIRDGYGRDTYVISQNHADQIRRGIELTIDTTDVSDSGSGEPALIGDSFRNDRVGCTGVPDSLDLDKLARLFPVLRIEGRADFHLGNQVTDAPIVTERECLRHS